VDDGEDEDEGRNCQKRTSHKWKASWSLTPPIVKKEKWSMSPVKVEPIDIPLPVKPSGMSLPPGLLACFEDGRC